MKSLVALSITVFVLSFRAYGESEASKGNANTIANALLGRLVKVQNSSGSWGKGSTWALTEGHPAHTGMVLYLFCESGETPISDRYGDSIISGTKWLIAYSMQQDLSRKVQQVDGAVAHAMATLGLSLLFANTKIPSVKLAMDKCIALIIRKQQANGAFGKAYDLKAWDLGVTAWNLLALGDAQLSGCGNPKLQQALNLGKAFLGKHAYLKDGLFKSSSSSPVASRHSSLAIKFLANSGGHDSRIVLDYIKEQIFSKKLPEYLAERTVPRNLEEWEKTYLYDCYFDHWLMFNIGAQISKKQWSTWRTAVDRTLLRLTTVEGNGKMVLPVLRSSDSTSNEILNSVFAQLPLEVSYAYIPSRLIIRRRE